MPIYEYRCLQCDNEFESLVTVAEAHNTSCPSCGAANPRRLMSVIAGMHGRSDSWGEGMTSAPTCGSGACDNCS